MIRTLCTVVAASLLLSSSALAGEVLGTTWLVHPDLPEIPAAVVEDDQGGLHLLVSDDDIAVNINNSHRTAGDELAVTIDHNHFGSDELAVNINNSHRTAGDELAVNINQNHLTLGPWAVSFASEVVGAELDEGWLLIPVAPAAGVEALEAGVLPL